MLIIALDERLSQDIINDKDNYVHKSVATVNFLVG